jgi:hypothetical protein
MTTFVNYYRVAGHCYSSNTCNVCSSVCFSGTDADGVSVISNTPVADINIITASRKIITGRITEGDVVGAGAVIERKGAMGCIVVAAYIGKQCAITIACVVVAGCIVIQRKSPGGRVYMAGCVICKRSGSCGCVVIGCRVVPERCKTGGGVLPARRITLERETTCTYV